MPRRSDPVHFLQIWIVPEKRGLTPSYEQKTFSDDDKRGRLRLVGSRDGRDGSVTIHRDVDLYASVLGDKEAVSHELKAGRVAWVQVARGSVTLNGEQLYPGDGVAIEAAGSSGADRHVGCRGARVRHGRLALPSEDGPAAAGRPARLRSISGSQERTMISTRYCHVAQIAAKLAAR